MGWRMLALDARRAHRDEGATGRPRRPVRHRQGLRRRPKPRVRSTRSASTDYMIEAGGEVRARGAQRRGPAVADRGRAAGRGAAARALRRAARRTVAIATSGDYRIYFERDGTRYCHEIDPGDGPADRATGWRR